MTAFAQCKECKNIYKFPVIDDSIPPCPKCGAKCRTDDGGFLINGLNPDDMFSVQDRQKIVEKIK